VTKADTRRFFLIGTAVCTLIFIGLTVHSHRTVVAREHSRNLSDEVRRGLRVWGGFNCENCHTLLGEGAYFAPDLTQIVQQRGLPYLKTFMADPSAFYSEEEHGRLMPTLGLTEPQIDDVLAFLEWVGGIDTQNWPPRPIRVSGVPTRLPGVETPAAAADAPSRGRRTFDAAGCGACHSVEPGVAMVGPSLAGVARAAAERIREADYGGEADDSESYLRESIVAPNAYIVPPVAKHSAPQGGPSFMPEIYTTTLEAQAVDDLVAYLFTLQ
jgi:nitric oxide reductase subunit C